MDLDSGVRRGFESQWRRLGGVAEPSIIEDGAQDVVHPDAGGVHQQGDPGGVLGGDGPHHRVNTLAVGEVALLLVGLKLA